MVFHSTTLSRPRPVVVIMTDRVELDGHAAHVGFHGYVRAVSEVAQALPLLLPAAVDAIDAESLIAGIDGVLLTGSPSNVAAERYGASPLPATTRLDADRDATVLALIPKLIASGVPVLGICRGFQELNVAFGGSLHPAVHEQPSRLDHREGDHSRPIQRWYDDSHELHVVPGGRLAQLAGAGRVSVNSLHHQCVDRLGKGLRIEATAPDGLIEAFSVEGAENATLAVQWHPEMRIDDCALSRAIFADFGMACRKRQSERLRLPYRANLRDSEL
ncbi:gamma-glutamyl-gamma-aminobutyrate hydrolase family protein [Bradyrhizobium sp. AS23.2]|uniref:gamma-glutamyl-gamma-aminobutyrate hydrolase family protein n=1 Tax=Bradyrhizobium sp. AS23.2 TaxID=1680155 RepID=UPI00093B2E69|nr:gamma-glutamyl-gamma-aminobutyrate hydrolase family protein [Bradyrhizobium sp. AS23.2]OKO84607.1 gamma-glutamyl-gamma-aminobutyrate hydrolase [Bradyrhizobium sp. AS23.2]